MKATIKSLKSWQRIAESDGDDDGRWRWAMTMGDGRWRAVAAVTSRVTTWTRPRAARC